MRTMILILTFAIGLVLLSYLGFNALIGAKLHSRSTGMQSRTRQGSPLGSVWVVERGSKTPGSNERFDIHSYNGMYRALGVDEERFTDWNRTYGVDSLGVASDGTLLAPGYPVFSKVAWMFVDPVELSDEEVKLLVIECERGMAATDETVVRAEFQGIRELALKAITRSATLRFGHP